MLKKRILTIYNDFLTHSLKFNELKMIKIKAIVLTENTRFYCNYFRFFAAFTVIFIKVYSITNITV